ncbi:MAG: type I 3-dehydroquinate dehydratase [Planctomycetes bacterium]|nr:type I 3-dehydroquinate dehydratase [Planctomycetota bacterium]
MSGIFDPPWIAVAASAAELERALAACGKNEGAAATVRSSGGGGGAEPRRPIAGGVELRLDQWPHAERASVELRRAAAAARARGSELIFAWRREEHGEGGAEGARTDFAAAAAAGDFGPCWLDFDEGDPLLARFLDRGKRAASTRWIVSAHFARPCSDREVEAKIRDLASRHPDGIKIVLEAEHAAAAMDQSARLLAARRGEAITIFARGREGSASRLAALAASPGAWGYARVRGAAGTDPGQPAIEALLARYALDPREPLPIHFAVIGAEVARSLSPGFHNALLRRSGVASLFADISTGAPHSLLSAPHVPLRGLAVTAPHKTWARGVAAPGDHDAARFPAWNTLRREPDGRWVGFNTDGAAALEILADAGIASVAPVAILGAGGAAQGISAALRHAGHPAACIARGAAAAAASHALRAARVLINATGAGRGAGDPLPKDWSLDEFRGELAIELVYDPPVTAFARRMESAGIAVRGGLEFFARQARLQARLLYGAEIDHTAARALAEKALADLCEDASPVQSGAARKFPG